jgi:hypothetical protein
MPPRGERLRQLPAQHTAGTDNPDHVVFPSLPRRQGRTRTPLWTKSSAPS